MATKAELREAREFYDWLSTKARHKMKTPLVVEQFEGAEGIEARHEVFDRMGDMIRLVYHHDVPSRDERGRGGGGGRGGPGPRYYREPPPWTD